MDLTGVIINGTPEYVRASVEASLKRLDVEYIDLYYQHRVDTTTPIEDTVSAAVESIIKLFLPYTIQLQIHRFSLFHIYSHCEAVIFSWLNLKLSYLHFLS